MLSHKCFGGSVCNPRSDWRGEVVAFCRVFAVDFNFPLCNINIFSKRMKTRALLNIFQIISSILSFKNRILTSYIFINSILVNVLIKASTNQQQSCLIVIIHLAASAGKRQSCLSAPNLTRRRKNG
jgi:hypothetical protein